MTRFLLALTVVAAPFVATAVVQLSHAGKVDLDAPSLVMCRTSG